MNKKYIKIITIIVVCLTIISLLFLFLGKKNNNGEENPNVEIKRTIFLEKKEMLNSVKVKGTVESNEVSSVSTSINTKVIELNVKVGDSVKKGDVIAKLDDTDIKRALEEKKKDIKKEEANLNEGLSKLIRQRDEAIKDKNNEIRLKDISIQNLKNIYNQKQKELSLFKAEYDDALNKKNYVNANIVGDLNNVNTLEASLQSIYTNIQKLSKPVEPIEPNIDGEDCSVNPNTPKCVAHSQYLTDKSKYDSDLVEYQNNKNKLDSDFNDVSDKLKSAKETLDKSKEVYKYDLVVSKFDSVNEKNNQLNASKIQAEENYNQAINEKNNSIKSMDANINSLNESIKAQEKQIKDFDKTKALKELNEKLANTVLKAESNGKVTELKVNLGKIADGHIATIQSTDKLMISAVVKDLDIAKLKKGQEVKVTSDTGSVEIKGELSRVSVSADEAGNFPIDISLNSTTGLYIGTKAKAEIIVFSKKNVFVVPKDAILEKEDGSYILVRNDDGFSELKINILDSNDNEVEISGDIKEGLEIQASAQWDSIKEDIKNSSKDDLGGF